MRLSSLPEVVETTVVVAEPEGGRRSGKVTVASVAADGTAAPGNCRNGGVEAASSNSNYTQYFG